MEEGLGFGVEEGPDAGCESLRLALARKLTCMIHLLDVSIHR